jgi:hypothetical protein
VHVGRSLIKQALLESSELCFQLREFILKRKEHSDGQLAEASENEEVVI